MTVAENGRLCWRDAETGRELSTTEGERDIAQLVLSPDGRTLVSGASLREHGLDLWDAVSGKHLGELAFNGPNVSPVQCRRVATADRQRQSLGPAMEPADEATAQSRHDAPGGRQSSGCIAQPVVHRDGTARRSGPGLAGRLPRPSAEPIPLDGHLQSCDDDRGRPVRDALQRGPEERPDRAKVYEVATGDVVARKPRCRRVLHRAAFSPDGRHAITLSPAADKPAVTAISTYPGQRPGGSGPGTGRPPDPSSIRSTTRPNPSGPPTVPTAPTAVVICGGGQVVTIDPKRAHPASIPSRLASAPYRTVRHSSRKRSWPSPRTGRLFLTWGLGPSAVMWDAATGQPRSDPSSLAGQCFSACYSPDGRYIVTASLDDNSARVWDAETGMLLSHPLLHPDWVFHAEFSPRRHAGLSRPAATTTCESGTGGPAALSALPPGIRAR